jgi:hypothetical protein
MIKCFRVHTTWFDGYEDQEVYYYCLGYRMLGKTVKQCAKDEETILEIVEIIRTPKSIRVCAKNTCSRFKNRCV